MWVHSLVCFSCIRFVCFLSWGHIPVRVCVCMAVLSFLQNDSIWIDVVAFACVSLMHSFYLSLFLGPPVTSVYVCVCAWLCPSFAKLFIWFYLDVFAFVSFWLQTHPSASVRMYICALLFSKLLIWFDVGAFACVSLLLGPHPSASACMHSCALLFAKLFIWFYLNAFAFVSLFMVLQCSTSVCALLYPSLCTIILRVFVCVYMHGCALLFAKLLI